MPLIVTVNTIADCPRTECNVLGGEKKKRYAMSLRKCELRENRCNKSDILHKGVNETVRVFYVRVSVHHDSILHKEPTRCSFGSIVY